MKKKLMIFPLAFAILTSCTTVNDKKVAQEDTTVVNTENSRPNVLEETGLKKDVVPVAFSALVPLDVLDAKSENVFEKYGIEFSGNCYACDLASLSIVSNKMLWTNVCDEEDRVEIENFSFSIKGDKTIIKTTERTYILTQIDDAPVYQLRIEGAVLEMNNKRIATYYTTKEALDLFKEHDCGEFDG